jgi:hypothetical protein
MKSRLLIAFIFLTSPIASLRAQSPPVVNVFSSAAYVAEGYPLYFIFQKDGAGTVRVPFSLAGSAVYGANYSTPFTANSVVIPDGVLDLSLFVQTLGDRSTNTDVTLFLQLQPAPSYQIGIGSIAGARIVQYFFVSSQNSPPSVNISATQFADRVDFKFSAYSPYGISRIWLFDNTNIITSLANFAAGSRSVSTNFSWTNPPAGRHEISAIASDTRGHAAGGSNTPPLVIIVGDQFTFPKEGAASTDGVTLTGDLVTSFDSAERHRRVLFEFAIPASATNSEGYLKFSTANTLYGQARTNEIFAYNGDGLLSTNDLYVAGEPVLKFVAPPGSADFQFDVTGVIRSHAGGYLGVWINDAPDPGRTSGFGYLATRFSNVKLEILPDSGAADEPTTATWLNPPVSRRISYFDPTTFSFQVVDRDSRVTAVELHSAESGLIARTEGTLFLGTNIVSLVWTNPIPRNHTLFLKTFNEDNAPATIQLGQLQVESLAAKVVVPPPSSPLLPGQNPIPVRALMITPTGGTFQAELSLFSTGEVLDRKQIAAIAGTNEITLSWSNAIPGTNIFLVRISDDRVNSSSATSPLVVVPEVDHKWLDGGDNIQSVAILDAAGRARVWGYGYTGGLGLGFLLDPPYFLSAPAELPPPPGLQWKQISSSGVALPGVQFHFGLASDGALYGWGYRDSQMFVFTAPGFYVIAPRKVPFPPGVSWWKKVVCGRYFVAAIDQDQSLWMWSPNDPPAKIAATCVDLCYRDESHWVALFADGTLTGLSRGLAPGVKPTHQFAASANHYLAIGDDGQLYAWGNNSNGELPFPTPLNCAVAQPTNGVHIAGVQSWTRVAATTNLSLAVDNNGRLFAWGSSTNSGVRNPVRNQPGLVDVPETGFLDIAVTRDFAVALSQRGNLYLWGTVYAPETRTHRRTIRFPEVVQGLPDLMEPRASATLATFDVTDLRSSASDISLNIVVPLSTPVEIQSSSDFQTWRTLTNFVTTTNRLRFLQPFQTGSNLFFRIR